jgi:hypothetical protein
MLVTVALLALPWAHALAQHPRRPFVWGALVSGVLGAVTLGVLTSRIPLPNPEHWILRSAAAAFLMGGPLGTLVGQGLVAMFVAPRQRQIGAVIGFLVGPLLGWPPLYLFPPTEMHLLQGPYWVSFWLGSWAGWCALGGAGLGMWAHSWRPQGKRALAVVLVLLIAPAVVVGDRHFNEIRIHVTPVASLAAHHDVAGILWKLDHQEEITAAAEALGPLSPGGDESVVSRLDAILDGTLPGMLGRDRSDPDYRQARCQAARSLAQVGALSILLKYTSEADPQVRGAVVEALATLPDPRAQQAVAKAATGDVDEDVRARARQALHPVPPGFSSAR